MGQNTRNSSGKPDVRSQICSNRSTDVNKQSGWRSANLILCWRHLLHLGQGGRLKIRGCEIMSECCSYTRSQQNLAKRWLDWDCWINVQKSHCFVFPCSSFHTCREARLLDVCQHTRQSVCESLVSLQVCCRRPVNPKTAISPSMKRNNISVAYRNKNYLLWNVHSSRHSAVTSAFRWKKSMFKKKKPCLSAIWQTISCLSLQLLAQHHSSPIKWNLSVHPLSLFFYFLTAILLNWRQQWKENQ